MAPKGKSNREKFEKLVEKRMTNVLHDLRLVGNLSNRYAYEYDEKDIKYKK